MNCLEFRHHLLTSPQTVNPAFTQHCATSCPACAREAQQARRFEQQLRAAVTVEIPEGLQARILLAQVLDKPQRSWRRHGLAMAASLLLAVVIAGGLGYRSIGFIQPNDLQTAVFKHVNDELDHLHEDRNLHLGQLTGLFSQFGARVDEGIGKVNYAGRCNIRNHTGLHLVVPGRLGPVTVLFMPDEPVSMRQSRRTERFWAVIVPTDYGSLAVIGEQGETALDEVLAKVSRSVTWGI